MSPTEQPGFRHLADEDDDPRWWGDVPPPPRPARAADDSRLGPLFDAPPPARDGEARRSKRPSPVLLGGGLAVLTAALLAAPALLRGPPHPQSASARAGLRVTRRQPVDRPVTPRRILPCYVDGESVGLLPLMDCAARNGVASGSLDAGADRPAPPPVQVAVAPPAPLEAIPDAPPLPPAVHRPREPSVSHPIRLTPSTPEGLADHTAPDHGWRGALGMFKLFARRPSPAEAPSPVRTVSQDRRPARPSWTEDGLFPGRFIPQASRFSDRATSPASTNSRRPPPGDVAQDAVVRDAPDDEGPTAEESALAANDFYRALGRADGERASSLVVPEKRRGGPLSPRAIDRFYSSLRAPLRITSLRPLDNQHVAVRYEFVDPDGVVCSGDSEVATTVREERVLVQSIRAHSRC